METVKIPFFNDSCGVFGIYSFDDCIRDLFYGIFNLQHRGQKYCGISTSDGKKIKLMASEGLVKHVFMLDDLGKLEGNLGIGHVSSRAQWGSKTSK